MMVAERRKLIKDLLFKNKIIETQISNVLSRTKDGIYKFTLTAEWIVFLCNYSGSIPVINKNQLMVETWQVS